ncbi:MCHR1 protein, partial [Polyodon spathula]|nr:MCHR1 protein [Polyodon spathula]
MPTVYGCICLLGVIGNRLVLYTVPRKTTLHRKHTAADIFMFSLSLVDLLVLLGMPFLIHQLVWYNLYQFFLAFAIPLVVICMVYIKILRYMVAAVVPLQHNNLEGRTKKVTRMAIAICTAFFICWAPFYFLQLVNP